MVPSRRLAIPIGAVALLVAVVAAAGLLAVRGGGPAASEPVGRTPAATLATPAGTGLVARLPFGQYSTFAWSPDGAYVLVSDGDQYVTRVYDRFVKLVSTFGSYEGWLDATHLIDGAGYVAAVARDHAGGPTANSWVVANGHGSAAIIVAVPGCVGDPLIDWYKNGGYVKASDKATPFGWSTDGRLLLLGHFECSTEDASLHGWRGPVQVIDFASGKILATAPAVRGEMAFSPSGTRLAAESDADLEIVDISSGQVETVPNVRFLGWSGDDYAYGLTTAGSVVAVPATTSIQPYGGIIVGGWTIPSPSGVLLTADASGDALRVSSADTKTTLLDLSSSGLMTARAQTSEYRLSYLQPRWWSPDGRMLALESSDGTSIALISVDPAAPETPARSG
jgi:WD40 repeat protein